MVSLGYIQWLVLKNMNTKADNIHILQSGRMPTQERRRKMLLLPHSLAVLPKTLKSRLDNGHCTELGTTKLRTRQLVLRSIGYRLYTRPLEHQK